MSHSVHLVYSTWFCIGHVYCFNNTLGVHLLYGKIALVIGLLLVLVCLGFGLGDHTAAMRTGSILEDIADKIEKQAPLIRSPHLTTGSTADRD